MPSHPPPLPGRRILFMDLEELIYLAWTKRFVITACVHAHDLHRVTSIALRRAPRPSRG